jgi:hypothetical protein
MVQLERSAEETVVRTASYRLVIAAGERRHARLEVPPGRPLADLVLTSSAHPPRAVDELLELGEIAVRPAADGTVVVAQESRSTVWQQKRAELCCRPEGLVYRATFVGSSALDDVQLFESGERDQAYLNRPTLSGFWRPARARERWVASCAHFPRVFSPAPNVAARSHFWSGERATNHPSNESGFWGGDWFFTPAPFAYGLGGDGRWLTVGLAPRRDDLGFVHFDYRGGERWGLALTYQGMARADGTWSPPPLVMLPSADEYAGLAAYRAWLDDGGLLPAAPADPEPRWREPIWCGWGEQVAREGRRRAKALSTRRNYERWLGILEQHGISPGTVVIDDRWQAHLGAAEPSGRWPDLRGFIAAQHRAGRRVLLWHNVWEVEAPEAGEPLITGERAKVAGAFGYPMRDPTAPGFAERMRRLMAGLLGPPPEGLGADGLKLDITHSTPSASGYLLGGGGPSARPSPWGNALLHTLLLGTYRAAKEARPDALVESHAANPYFRDTCDVLRLNDVFTDLASVVPQMRHRARVARAAGFDLIDTDGWAMPSRAALLEYVETQPELGIPALYYATRVDRTREPLHDADYRRIAAVWVRYRQGL